MSEILQTEESVKLYEYELYKPELDQNVLAHHGILGMHWGKRNGPPYPLSRAISTGRALKKKMRRNAEVRKAKKRRKAQEKQYKIQEKNRRTKEQILKDHDVEAILKDIGNFSSQEINMVLDRIRVEENLKREVDRQRRASQPKLKRALNDIKSEIGAGLASGGKRLVRDASENLVQYTARQAAKAAKESGDKDFGEFVDALVNGKRGGGKKNKNKNKNRNGHNKNRRNNNHRRNNR